MSEECSHNCSTCSSASSCQSKNQPPKPDNSKYLKHTIVVMSGKGGVGKSTVSVNLAVSLALKGKKVGLLDVDIHGPSIPTMLHLQNEHVMSNGEKLFPVEKAGVKVISVGLLLENPDDAIIWRGPMKIGAIGQFINDVDWGELDYLIVDAPPGTGDEPLSVFQTITGKASAIIVTTPQEVSAADVRKSLNFCKVVNVKVEGIIENMSGFVCPCCKTLTPIFSTGGGEKLAKEFNVPFLGKIPIEPEIGQSCDKGEVFAFTNAKSETGKIFADIADKIIG